MQDDIPGVHVESNLETPENLPAESPTNLLLLSSLVFITNVISGIWMQHYIYAILFFLLTVSSLAVHSNNNIYTNIIDKVILVTIGIYGAYVFYNKITVDEWITGVIVVMTCLTCIVFYFYGYAVKNYCFHNELCVAQMYHAIMHIVGSIGHHLAIFL